MHRRDQCLCGSMKDSRARQCKDCRAREWALNKKPRRRDYCICGNQKDCRAKSCLVCAKLKFHTGLRRLVCPCCGGNKSYKAKKCFKCCKNNDSILSCCSCKLVLLPHQFYYVKGIRKPQCIVCWKKSARIHNIRQKCAKYNVDLATMEKIASLSGVICPICGEWAEKFHIDHCHKTNKFRGLLCSNCNSGLGLFKDNIERLQKAIEYLDMFESSD